jgi:type IV secretory pathway component VirB8
VEAIADPEELHRNRRLAWRVMTLALVTAILATGLFAVATVPVS